MYIITIITICLFNLSVSQKSIPIILYNSYISHFYSTLYDFNTIQRQMNKKIPVGLKSSYSLIIITT